MEAHRNPFRVECLEALAYRPSAGCLPGGAGEDTPETWRDALLDRLIRRGGRGALVGPKGLGKTTLLEAMGRDLARRGYRVVWLRLSCERRAVDWRTLRRDLNPGGKCLALLLDGAEQLNLARWWRVRLLARRATVLLVTTHRPGRLPTLHRHAASPELLGDLVRALLDNTVHPYPDYEQLQTLFQRHDGNLRECLRTLYDRYSSPSILFPLGLNRNRLRSHPPA